MDKKKIKILKNALTEERAVREKIEKDLAKAKEKIITLTKNLEEKEEKYLSIYQENMQMHEALQEL